MDKFRITKEGQDKDSINRTIRFRGSTYDKLMTLVDKTNISFNRLVNEAIQFALDRLEEDE